jgi:hypothetical protein
MRCRKASYAPPDHQSTTRNSGWLRLSQPPMSFTCG